MHELNIFHLDIKTDNLMFSPKQKKIVFIDYNLSEILSVKKGNKTLLGFRGTLEYCHSSMLNVFYSTNDK